MAVSKVRLSEAAINGLDIKMNPDNLCRKEDGSLSGNTDAWQLAMQYAILQELKQLNCILGCHNVTGGMMALQRIDRRLAKRRPLKGKRK
jgi:hypothetical protein